MTFNPDIHHRQSIRLKNYDYSQVGLYFITVCSQHRQPLFGRIVDAKMRLNEAGVMVENYWRAISTHFPHAMLESFVVMPNHLHGIISITNHPVGANNHLPSPLQHGTSKTIGSMVRGFKMAVTRWFREHPTIYVVWQRNYHEHIIRNNEAYLKISQYIQTNPQRWQEDTYHI